MAARKGPKVAASTMAESYKHKSPVARGVHASSLQAKAAAQEIPIRLLSAACAQCENATIPMKSPPALSGEFRND
jgi:hypothetical protein